MITDLIKLLIGPKMIIIFKSVIYLIVVDIKLAENPLEINVEDQACVCACADAHACLCACVEYLFARLTFLTNESENLISLERELISFRD